MGMNDNSVMVRELELCRSEIEKRLSGYFTAETGYKTLLESMRYSLLDGGKRIRAVVCVKFCEAASGNMENAFNAACAIEMLHAYSLVHDDLPCMDDDDMRRGKPSNHIKYGECTAILAGDALQSASFETLLESALPPDRVVEMARVFARAAGPYGICGGQYLDIFENDNAPDMLAEIHKLKTAALFEAAAQLGTIAGGGTREQIRAALEYAEALGLAFQARDDILDDMAQAEESERVIRLETEKAIAAVTGKFQNVDFLIWLAQMLAERNY
ncbi:MAG: polyprenyl synthetase family protein [Oscillospiraceae bacterium]|nr:polyprenyl synthetase family protein [Oscillospiraceae bacterium]